MKKIKIIWLSLPKRTIGKTKKFVIKICYLGVKKVPIVKKVYFGDGNIFPINQDESEREKNIARLSKRNQILHSDFW